MKIPFKKIAIGVLGGIVIGYFVMPVAASINKTLTTNLNLETGLVNHWPLDGAYINTSQSTAEIRDRVGGKHGDNITSAAMSAGYVTTSSWGAGTTQTPAASFSWTHNHSGGNFLVVGVSIVDTVDVVSSITYGGVALRRAIVESSGSYRSEIWYLPNPTSGSNTVAVTLSGTPTEVHASAVSLSDVSASNPIDTTSSGVATGNSVTANYTTNVANTVAIDVLASSDNGAVAVNAGQTERWDVDLGADVHALGTEVIASAGANSAGWDTANGETNVLAVAVFQGDQPSKAELVPGKIGQGLEFNRATTTNYIDLGNVGGTVRSIAFWVYVDDATSEKIIDLDGTDQIETNASDQITGTSFPGSVTYYVDGVAGARVLRDKDWHHVVITDTTGVSPTNMDIGRVGTAYFNGKIDDLRFYSTVLTQADVTRLAGVGQTTKQNKAITTNPDLWNGLVLHWTFDASNMNWSQTTAEARDSSGNSRHGNVENATNANVKTGKIGQAIDFSQSTTHRITYSTVSALPTGDLTYAFWVRLNTSATAGLVDIPEQGVGGDEFNIQVSSSKVLVSTNNTLRLTTTKSLDVRKWHHIIVMRSGTRIVVYIDGVLDPTQGIDGTAMNFSGCSMFVGANANSSCLSPGSSGIISLDDFRIYNRALSFTEILRLYQLGATTKVNKTLTTNPDLENGLVHHYTFDGPNMSWGASSEVLDRGSNPVAGDFSGTRDNIVPGRFGQALHFTNRDVSVLSPGLPTGAFTYAAWVYQTTVTPTGHIVLESHTIAGSEELSLYVNSSNQLVGVADGTSMTGGGKKVPPNEWAHVAFSRTSAGVFALYVNGENVTTVGATDSDTLSFDCPFVIGDRETPTGAACIGGIPVDDDFIGAIDDVRVYNRALSAAEILRLYQLGN